MSTDLNPELIEWISNKDADLLPETDDIGCMGGFFKMGMRWGNYISAFNDEYKPYFEALRKNIIKNKIWKDGGWHQSNDECVPFFKDGKYATFTMRAWGDLMAAVWSQELNKDFHYMDFYYLSVPESPFGD